MIKYGIAALALFAMVTVAGCGKSCGTCGSVKVHKEKTCPYAKVKADTKVVTSGCTSCDK